MATTTTTNIKLVKPDYSEAADVQVLNGNADKIDAAFGETYNDLGIVVNGNKSALSAAIGKFVILKNSTISGRSDGLYTAAKAIPANTAIDSSYLTAVSGGGLNALTSKFESLQSVAVTWDSNYTPTRSDVAMLFKKGVVCQLVFWNVSWANTISGDTGVAPLPVGYGPLEKISFIGFNGQNQLCRGWLDPNGVIRMSYYPGGLMYASITYLSN